MKKTLSLLASAIILSSTVLSCGQKESSAPDYDPPYRTDGPMYTDSDVVVEYKPLGVHEQIQVEFNGVPFNMMVDTGCSVTSITQTDFVALVNEDAISADAAQSYAASTIADGSTVYNRVFRIEKVVIKGKNGRNIELHDVDVCVAIGNEGARLLGKNIIDQLGDYKKNETEHCLVFGSTK